MQTGGWLQCGVIVLAMVACVPAAQNQANPAAQVDEGAGLAKKLSNPIADLISVPFQMNWVNGVGPNEQTRFILNIQP